jgi:hypothetical protein
MGPTLRRSLHVGLALGIVSVAVRVGIGVVSIGAGAAAVEGCSVTATDGGALIQSQNKYQGNQVSLTSMGSYNGEIIKVFNQNGDVVVKGDPSATSITLTTTPFAFADPGQDADGAAAIADVKGTIVIDQGTGGTITVRCSVATGNHGSAKNGTTGCDNFTVTVPAGSTMTPTVLTSYAQNGSLQVTNVTLSDSAVGQQHSDNGNVTVSVNGSAKVDSGNGEVVATIVPNVGSTLEASSSNGSVTLSLPKSFAADMVSLSASGGTVNVASGFSNAFTATSTSVGTAGSGAHSLTASTENGDITIQPQ